MTQILLFSEMVEENGKTVRENNLARKHQVRLGAKLKICVPLEPDDLHPFNLPGLRGVITCYVVYYNRDCDGSPLYYISPYDTAVFDDSSPLWDFLNSCDLSSMLCWMNHQKQYNIDGPYGEEFIFQHLER